MKKLLVIISLLFFSNLNLFSIDIKGKWLFKSIKYTKDSSDKNLIPISNGDYMLINEEGKFKDFAINYTASSVWEKHFGKTDLMLGNAIIIKSNARSGGW